MSQGFGDAEIGVVEFHILAHQCNVDFLGGILNIFYHPPPCCKLWLMAFDAQHLANQLVQTLLVQKKGDLIQRGSVGAFHDVIGFQIAKKGYLFTLLPAHPLEAPAYHDIRLNTFG